MNVFFWILLSAISVNGVSDAAADEVSVVEGESATLNSGFKRTQKDRMGWYFNNIRIAGLNGDQINICADDVCPKTFRGRLKLDNTSGSLIIANTRKTDSGPYQLQINNGRMEKKFIVTVQDLLGADTSEFLVSVMEGDSVTLCTGVQTNQNHRIKWYFNTDRIAVKKPYQHKICTDDACSQRFRDRLKLDNQTGSLTIVKISTADLGLYTLQILNYDREVIFRVVVLDSSAEELENLKRKSVTEGESITLDTHNKTTPNDVLKWYFGEILLAEITGDENKTCEDVQCKDGQEGFRDRLKVNHSSGFLTIMNTRTADSGEYTLLINSTTFYISRNVTVIVSAASVLGLSSITIIGICAGVLVLLTVAAIAVYYVKKKAKKTRETQQENTDQNGTGMQKINQNSVSDPGENERLLNTSSNHTSHNQEEPEPNTSANQTSHNQEEPEPNTSANQTSHNQEEPRLSDSANQTSHNQEEPEPNTSANQTSHNQEEPQPNTSANQTSHNQEEPRLSDSANQTSSNKEHVPYMDEVHEDEYIPGIKVIQPENDAIL